ncbi:hypothetical protein [Zhongshania sp. BJYM1]|uniref:hypothetical protein n=1 Tax=Zhongshania aquatica TaxID=2965069 RepID=UPI0022B509BE|nr:hypothetical protein [Marortus sp. BJYM1]
MKGVENTQIYKANTYSLVRAYLMVCVGLIVLLVGVLAKFNIYVQDLFPALAKENIQNIIMALSLPYIANGAYRVFNLVQERKRIADENNS